MAPGNLEVRIGDSKLVRGPVSGGSRTTASLVPAAIDAAEQARKYLIEQAASVLGVRGTPGHGGIKHAGGLLPWAEVLAAAMMRSRVSVPGRAMPVCILSSEYT